RWVDPEFIPDGNPERPGTIDLTLGGGGESILVRRVIVTNILSHELFGDLQGLLKYEDGTMVVLNNHSLESGITNRQYVYDDSDEGDHLEARPSDGPGSLLDFGGKRVSGTWTFSLVDSTFNHVGTNEAIIVWLEKQQDMTEGITGTLLPGRCTRQFVEVGPQVTRLEIDAALLEGSGPLTVEVCPVGRPDACVTNVVVSAGTTTTIVIDLFSNPPLTPGVYQVRLCNEGSDLAKWFLLARLITDPSLVRSTAYVTNPLVAIQDDSITYASIDVAEHMMITSLDVGLLINHPRISDLAITLISPNGTRILLTENRGALSVDGLGGAVGFVTNSLGVPVYAVTNLVPFYTNDFERAAIGRYAPSAEFQGWNVLSNYATVSSDYALPWLSNNILVLGDSGVSTALPTTNSTSYRLTFRATHAPYLVGTIGWWSFDGNGTDIFGGWDGLLFGGGDQTNLYSMFSTGKVNQAFYGDGVRSGMVVPGSADLNLSAKRGVTVEGWIKPGNLSNAAPLVEWNKPAKTTTGGGPVTLQQPTATWSQTSSGDFSVARAIDGVLGDNLGWAIQFGIADQTAVFETTSNVGFEDGTVLSFTLTQNAYLTYHPDTLGRFRISVTTDDRSTFADGQSRSGDVGANWTVLEPISQISANGATLTRLPDNSILASGAAPDLDVYTVLAKTPLTNITGVRLEVLTDPSLPSGGPGREPNNGNFVLT
ncbi:MAG TPA: proprotein convertase P-domain-containing protein, partial [Clostridia bacterium]|nr:proprotein convertase P-domain-containing protein [Clostridia bacterium]